jgi:hypothetical protein
MKFIIQVNISISIFIGSKGFRYGVVFTDYRGVAKEITPSLVSLLVSEQYQTRNGTDFENTYQDYNLTTCTEEKLPGITELASGQLYGDAILCPDNYDFPMYGSYGSQELRGISIRAVRCSGDSCASQAEINAYLADAR